MFQILEFLYCLIANAHDLRPRAQTATVNVTDFYQYKPEFKYQVYLRSLHFMVLSLG